MANSKPLAPALRDLWHVVATSQEVPMGGKRVTTLFEAALTVTRNERLRVMRNDDGSLLPVIERYGCIWTSFGTPSADLFPIIEYGESDRRNVIAGSIGVNVSAPRAIAALRELGDETDDWREPQPFCAMLYRQSAADPERSDITLMFCQPLTDKAVRLHLMLSLVEGSAAEDWLGHLQDPGRWLSGRRQPAVYYPPAFATA